MAVLLKLLEPFIGYIVGALALVGVLSGFYFKIKHDAVVADRAKIEQEKVDAISKANEAREHVRELCGGSIRTSCPAEWFRD